MKRSRLSSPTERERYSTPEGTGVGATAKVCTSLFASTVLLCPLEAEAALWPNAPFAETPEDLTLRASPRLVQGRIARSVGSSEAASLREMHLQNVAIDYGRSFAHERERELSVFAPPSYSEFDDLFEVEQVVSRAYEREPERRFEGTVRKADPKRYEPAMTEEDWGALYFEHE